MRRFGYFASEVGDVEFKNVVAALGSQLRQEQRGGGRSEQLGKIMLRKKFITPDGLESTIQALKMEPNINWSQETLFSRKMNDPKTREFKQKIGEYVGKKMAQEHDEDLVFLSDSSTVFYAFLGMMKHSANVEVLTINAAVITAYSAFMNDIKSVSTVWNGAIDVNNALMNPVQFTDETKSQFIDLLQGQCTRALIPTIGFDSKHGPMGRQRTSREVARLVLQSNIPTWVVMDHTKIRRDTKPTNASLLFPEPGEWRSILDRGHVQVVVNCHPYMPESQVSGARVRSLTEIKRLLTEEKNTPETIEGVLKYAEWARRMAATDDFLIEV